MPSPETKTRQSQTELERLRSELFEARLRLGCVEQDHPGLADAAYKRFCESMAQIAVANPAPESGPDLKGPQSAAEPHHQLVVVRFGSRLRVFKTFCFPSELPALFLAWMEEQLEGMNYIELHELSLRVEGVFEAAELFEEAAELFFQGPADRLRRAAMERRE